ncbi:halocyanin domain-containing protein [Haloplanus ruber]|uniref:Halocyanin domain-containing protein n=1 Tax=Haloplanus ruber TaxID=869892 RepID=A0ABD6CUN9_9EURY|nr:halocyanin domain-containing protein [Haloplanus ruber]
MSDSDAISRRRLLGIGATATLGVLAGCSGASAPTASDDESETEAQTDAESATATETASPTATDSGGDGGSGGASGGDGVPAAVSEYLADVGNFDGTVQDMTGQDTVTVSVGAEGNNGYFAYAPPAIAVSTGTTVQWEWTGQGAGHNVIAEDGAFDSGSMVTEAGVHFEHTFEESGVYNYFCQPHKALGMKASVVVR